MPVCSGVQVSVNDELRFSTRIQKPGTKALYGVVAIAIPVELLALAGLDQDGRYYYSSHWEGVQKGGSGQTFGKVWL